MPDTGAVGQPSGMVRQDHELGGTGVTINLLVEQADAVEVEDEYGLIGRHGKGREEAESRQPAKAAVEAGGHDPGSQAPIER